MRIFEYMEAARLFAILSEPARLEILKRLAKKKGCVFEIQLATGRQQPNVSQHLRVLRDAGLVACRREGKRICYSLASKQVRKLLKFAEKMEGG
ncbi:MAG: metalloregulator ArsR/SmtB family transcription factor [Candidatus Micrarchaeota archaeon]|nr:metalloregulator ArsR/SmtB family transcription factor [Candidatus Micrarchaeota archaeon]